MKLLCITSEDGVYFEDSNTVVLNSVNIDEIDGSVPDVEWDPGRTYHEQIRNVNEKDILLKELKHGLQDQNSNVPKFDYGILDNLSRRLGLMKVPEQA